MLFAKLLMDVEMSRAVPKKIPVPSSAGFRPKAPLRVNLSAAARACALPGFACLIAFISLTRPLIVALAKAGRRALGRIVFVRAGGWFFRRG